MKRVLIWICFLISAASLGFLVWVHFFVFERKLEGDWLFITLYLVGIVKGVYVICIGLCVLFFGLGIYLLSRRRKQKMKSDLP